MKDKNKTKMELMEELKEFRERITEIECGDAGKALVEERNLLRNLIDNLPDLIYVKDRESRFITCNIAVAHLLGVRAPEELVGKTGFDFYPQKLAKKYNDDEQELIRSGKPVINREEHIITSEGEKRWFSITKVPLRDSDEKVVGIVATGRDITERKLAEEALRESEERYRKIFENTVTASIVIEKDDKISLANEEFERLSGFPKKEIEGKKNLTTFVKPEDLEWIKELLRLRRKRPNSVPNKYEFNFIDRHGKIKHTLLTIELIPGTKKSIASLFDITDHKQNELRLQKMATHDELTKIPNRRLFQERLVHALYRAHRHKQLLGILYLDLDDFKDVNDSLGHEVGDLLLKAVADRLLECVRENDTVSRIGGDEFTIILEDAYQLEDIVIVAERIIESIAKPFTLVGHKCTVTISIGISIYPHDDKNWQALIKKSDAAMYRAKRLGKNNFQFVSKDKY